MKVGLVSLPMTWNYGGILQQYALQQILKSEGHDVIVLTIRKDRKSIFKNSLVRVKWFLISLIGRINLKGISSLTDVEYFKNTYFDNLTRSFFDDVDIDNFIRKNNIDALLVGSDQIWNRDALPNLRASFLGYEVRKKLSYAASFAKPECTYAEEEVEYAKSLLKDFCYVSVRETGGAEIMSSYFEMESQVVLDPTLLLNSSDYDNDIALTEFKDDYVFSYVLDMSCDKKNFIKRISDHFDLAVFDFNSLKTYRGVEAWLSRLRSAKFIITDSYHGVCFSIVFKKDFLVVENESRGSDRFKTVLGFLGLQDRLVKEADINEFDLNKVLDINWDQVDKAKNKLAADSLDFLKYLK